ncbi:MAG: lamin tail domain-containing protein [Dehalococcoidia bacterium]
MVRWKSLPILGGAVLVLVISGAAMPTTTATAQDFRALAMQYLTTVMLTQGDSVLSGYQRTDTQTLAIAEGGTELAARRVDFESAPRGAPRLRGFRVTGRVFSAAETAAAVVSAFRQNRSIPVQNGEVIDYEWMGSIAELPQFAAVEHGEFFRFTRRTSTGQIVESGTGAAWRRGAVQFTITAAGPTGFDNSDEVVRLLTVQDAKAERLGPFRPMPPPSPMPARAADAIPPSMGVVGTAQISGALAPDGAEVRALVNGVVCGRGTTLFGFFLFSIDSILQRAGCGTPGATVAFSVNGTMAPQTLSWVIEDLYTPINVSVDTEPRGGERLVRPILSIECRPLPGTDACSEREQLLWRSNIRAWTEEAGTEDGILSRWLQFRADRGEPFGMLLRAVREQQPYTFISSVQFSGSADEPEPYVTIINVGAPRPLGGWQIITGTDARFTFPAGFTLAPGVCRIYLGSRGNPQDNTCPDAFFSGADQLATENEGYLLLQDEAGRAADVVAWSP